MNSVKLGIVWNSIQQFGSLGINLISVVVLARLLTPQDYGVYGILMIFISIADLFIDSGMGGAVIRKQQATQIDFSTLFVYNMGMGLLLYLLYYICAPIVADFYKKDELIDAIRLLGLAIIFFALANTQNTKLLKELNYKVLALTSILAGAVSLTIAIIMALNDFGYWALIAQQIGYQCFSSIFLIIYTRYIPKISFDYKSFKEQIGFGIHLVVSSCICSISSNITNNIMGKTFSLSTTGLYTQANKLSSYPVSISANIIDRTFFPIFSQMNGKEGMLYLEVKRLRLYLFALFFPLFGCLICFADNIVPFVLGEKWIDSVLFFQYLIIGALPLLGKAMNRSILKAMGITKAILKTEVLSLLVLFVFLSLSIYYKSVIMMVWAFIFSSYAAFFVSSFYISKKTKWSLWEHYRDFFVFLPMFLIPIAITLYLSDTFLTKLVLFPLFTIVTMLIYSFCGNKTYMNLISVVKINKKKI